MKYVWLLTLLLAAGPLRGADQAADSEEEDRLAVQIEALSRLKDVDLDSNPAMKNVVLKVLDKTRGRPQFVDLVRDFKIKGQEGELLSYAIAHPGETAGMEAFKLVLASGNMEAIKAGLNGTNAAPLTHLIAESGEKQLEPILKEGLVNGKDAEVRKEAVKGLAKSQEGAAFILKLAREEKLPGDVKLIASSELAFARWPEIKKEAAALLPLPQGQNAEPLPPISQLARRKGDPEHGKQVFFSATVGCANCHQVNGMGADFGPKLSEIGTKLGKDAIYESILDPSAGIAFGYEAWQIELKNGDEAFGLLASETQDEIAVKTQNGITTKYKKAEVAKRTKMATSIMPAGLQMTMSTQDLVDLVEYLSTLKKMP